jgi:hypothetical protein
LEVEELFDGRGKNRKWIGRLKKVRLWDKSRNLENILKHLRLLNEKDEDPARERDPQEFSGMSDDDLNRKLVLIISRITGQPIPKVQIEGRPTEAPPMITEGSKPGSRANGGSAEDLINEILQKQKMEKGGEEHEG